MSDLQSPWFVLRTDTRREERTFDQLQLRGIEAYFPFYTDTQNWARRKPQQVKKALFASYIFGRFDYLERARVLDIPGVIEVLTCNQKPATVPDSEIENLRVVVASGLAEPWNLLKVGQQVTITAGPFAGIRGRLLKVKNKLRLIVGIDLLNRGAAVPVELENYMVTA